MEVGVVPPTVYKLHCLGAALKAGGYRSSETYFGIYKAMAERTDHIFTAAMVRAVKDGVRSCTRGMGAPVRAMPLPFGRLQ